MSKSQQLLPFNPFIMIKIFFNIKSNIRILTICLFASLHFLFPHSLFSQINAEQVLTIGRNVLSMDDYMLAIQYFNQAIKAKPYLADPYFFRALAKLNLEDYKGAEDDCTLAIERNKFKTEAYKVRGFARQQLGKDSLAILDYKEGLNYDPYDKYFLFYKAIAETTTRKYNDADTTFSLLLRLNPNFDDAYTARGKLYLEMGDTVKALSDIDKSISLSKSQINAYLMKAEIEWNQKNWEQADVAIGEAIRLRPEIPDLYINRAYVRYNSDDYFGAMSDYNYAIELDPNNSAAIFNRALLRYEVRDYERSEQDLTKVLALEPNNFHAIYNRGLIRLELNKNQGAYTDFAKIAAKYPRFYPVYYAMAEAKRRQGDMRSAVLLAHQGEELVAKYVKNPRKNPLDKPMIAAAQSNSRKRNDNKEEDEDSEDNVMERFNRLVTVSSVAETELSYNDRIKGKVQDRDVQVGIEPAYALSFVDAAESLKSVSNYFKELDDLNQMNLIRNKLYLTPGINSASFTENTPDLFQTEENLKESIKQGKNRPVDYLSLGIIQTMLHNYKEALENLDAALNADPHFTVALMARGFARYADAVDEMKLAKTDDEQNAMIDRRLYAHLLQDAVSDFDAALRLNPRLVYAWFNKGNIYYGAGDYTSAMQCYTEALKLDPDFGQAYFNRGLSYLQAGNKNLAFPDLSKAGELGVLPSYNILKRMTVR